MMMADDGRINHSKSKGIEVRNDVRGSWEGGTRSAEWNGEKANKTALRNGISTIYGDERDVGIWFALRWK